MRWKNREKIKLELTTTKKGDICKTLLLIDTSEQPCVAPENPFLLLILGRSSPIYFDSLQLQHSPLPPPIAHFLACRFNYN